MCIRDRLRAKLFRDKYFALVKSVRDAATVEVADEELKKRLAEIEGTQQ